MNFKRERAKDIIDDIKPLIIRNWQETGFYKDIPLDPDFERYVNTDDSGFLRIFTARNGDGELCGYAIFFVVPHLQFRSSLQASQDVIYLDPECRGIAGVNFIRWCEDELRKEGVQLLMQHISCKTEKTLDLFKNLGYEEVEIILGKRLDYAEV